MPIIAGPLPAELSLLSQLQSLNLADNLLTGGLPDFLGDMPGLQYLSLFNNNFSGERMAHALRNPFGGAANHCQEIIASPPPLCTHTHTHTGTVPSSLCKLGLASPLLNLVLSSNSLTGSLNVSTCGSLYSVDVSVSGDVATVKTFTFNLLSTARKEEQVFGDLLERGDL